VPQRAQGAPEPPPATGNRAQRAPTAGWLSRYRFIWLMPINPVLTGAGSRRGD